MGTHKKKVIKMNRLLILAACVAVAFAGTVQKKTENTAEKKNDWDGWYKPSFCRENDCPVYDLLERTDAYELRSYKAGQWVSTQIEDIDYPESNPMFMRLFRYIDGANDREEKVEMTSPVITRIIPGSGPNCKSTYRMSFYIEWSKQNTAPVPTESGVFLETLPAMNIYTTSFGGFPTIQDYLNKVIELGAAIGDERLFNTGFWYRVGYDSPWRPFNRHNEVWLVARD